ncbi:MAG: VOC family protein [Hyphomicrobiaceae bacterium]
MYVVGFDHLVLTVTSIPVTSDFYERVLGMTTETFGAGRTALRFGPHKINLHQADNTFEPKADRPTVGSADVCLLVDSLEGIEAHLVSCGVPLLLDRSTRAGARGPINSVYIRDPDGNLIELSVYQDGTRPAQ